MVASDHHRQLKKANRQLVSDKINTLSGACTLCQGGVVRQC